MSSPPRHHAKILFFRMTEITHQVRPCTPTHLCFPVTQNCRDLCLQEALSVLAFIHPLTLFESLFWYHHTVAHVDGHHEVRELLADALQDLSEKKKKFVAMVPPFPYEESKQFPSSSFWYPASMAAAADQYCETIMPQLTNSGFLPIGSFLTTLTSDAQLSFFFSSLSVSDRIGSTSRY